MLSTRALRPPGLFAHKQEPGRFCRARAGGRQYRPVGGPVRGFGAARRIRVWVLVVTVLAGCSGPRPAPPPSGVAEPPAEAAAPVYQSGEAAYYGARFAGRTTASGEAFDPQALTAAHRRLALGTRVRVTNVDNGRTVTVRINDRGPYADGRIIDLSRAAAERLGMIESGVATVELRRID